jgi:hypothetical protein
MLRNSGLVVSYRYRGAEVFNAQVIFAILRDLQLLAMNRVYRSQYKVQAGGTFRALPSHFEIRNSMKRDVKGQSFAYDRRRRIGLDIQPQTTGAGNESCVLRRFHRLRVLRGSIC